MLLRLGSLQGRAQDVTWSHFSDAFRTYNPETGARDIVDPVVKPVVDMVDKKLVAEADSIRIVNRDLDGARKRDCRVSR